ncbi:MAG: MarR family transcriptional regulator, partial [Methanobacteriota archaeon]
SLIFFIGVSLFLKGGEISEEGGKNTWNENLSKLKLDERQIYKLIMDENGTIFQGDLVEKSGLSKVKVSRTLDKLEARRLLERRRRGLTNIIVLK